MDDQIVSMASVRMGDIVMRAESDAPRLGYPGYEKTAAQFLVAQLYTDAVFNEDITAIQTIVSRIDGLAPSSDDMGSTQNEFGECLESVLAMTSHDQCKVYPDDTVMMALAKTLYDIATKDIYTEAAKQGKRKPSVQDKQEHSQAVRMLLERVGGRKGVQRIEEEAEVIEIADWIAELPESTE